MWLFQAGGIISKYIMQIGKKLYQGKMQKKMQKKTVGMQSTN